MQKRYITILLISLIAIMFVIFAIYEMTEQTISDAPKNFQARNIETPVKLWLNGYLGTLFRFQYVGVINWLIIPLLILYLLRKKIRDIPLPVLGIGVFFIIAFGIIAWKGFFNYRYQFTLVPAFTFFIFLLVWLLFKDVDKKILYAIAIGLLLLNAGNFLRYVPYTRNINLKTMAKKVYYYIQEYHINQPKNTANVNKKTVDDIYHYIDTMKTKSLFLVNNLPGFYYYTSKQGLYYWSGVDLIYTRKGTEPLFAEKSDSLVLWQLTNIYGCRYILTAISYYGYNQRFDDFLNAYCTLVVQDKMYELHELTYR